MLKMSWVEDLKYIATKEDCSNNGDVKFNNLCEDNEIIEINYSVLEFPESESHNWIKNLH